VNTLVCDGLFKKVYFLREILSGMAMSSGDNSINLKDSAMSGDINHTTIIHNYGSPIEHRPANTDKVENEVSFD
jgi:hypothetical protein